ncbi:plasmid maintenance system killer protein [Gluconacetobacter takamatsuzukensis]|uniref:Plasmid maintenance system killer protein n=1 Tax=Gluconacetobacter takamatsuzukensis TaxID=1286190 RepID=A0A7W4PQB1_9PROT|nr:plasmid maintenance system killer protein [Gluconacetobacter takamatsuzukensis]
MFRRYLEVSREKCRCTKRRIESPAALPPGCTALPVDLESLSGDRAGRYSIRVNDRFRTCFVWKDDGPHPVEIVDYHGGA